MRKILWRIEYTSPPKAVRYCKKCGAKSEFISSGMFRINAQQKCLDVWLVYKCSRCDTTWNLTIYSRVNPKNLPCEVLEGFHSNSESLAAKYAMDTGLLMKNGVETLTLPEYEVFGDDIDVTGAAELHIVSVYPSDVRVSAVLREKLRISRKAFEKMLGDGKMRCISGHDLQKSKLNGEIIIKIAE